MQVFLKMVFCISILLLCFWIVVPVFGFFIPLELAKGEFIYESIRGFGFPIAVMLTLTGTIKSNDTFGEIATKVFLTICVSGFSIFFMVMTLFTGMCDYSTDKVLFENKKNSSIKIVQRSFGCGATDSSPATLSIFKVKEITPYLIWVTSIDTNQINKSDWISIENIKQ